MRLELHCHSHYSKGVKLPTEGIPRPRDIIRTAKKRGLDGIAITDHHVFRATQEAKKEAKRLGVLFIPGEEVSSQEGHVIGLGLSEQITSGQSLAETIDRIHQQGAIAVTPHPFDIKGDGVREGFRKADAAEVFNSLNMDRFSNRVARKRLKGFPKVVGSDAHSLEMIGMSTTLVEARDLDGVLKAIKKGHTEWEANYTPLAVVKAWSHQRFVGSQMEVRAHVLKNYSPFKQWLSLRLMDNFVRNQGGFFSLLAHIGFTCSIGYGFVKSLRLL